VSTLDSTRLFGAIRRRVSAHAIPESLERRQAKWLPAAGEVRTARGVPTTNLAVGASRHSRPLEKLTTGRPRPWVIVGQIRAEAGINIEVSAAILIPRLR